MPALGVTVAIMKEGGAYLTLRQDFPVWCLPGGTVEPGESLAQAAIREALEETGLLVRLTGMIGIYSRVYSRAGGMHEVLFAAEAIGGDQRPDPSETLQVRWFPFDQLPERLMAVHRVAIQDAAAAGPTVARRVIAYPSLAKFSREQLYLLRDQGKLDLDAFVAELCATLDDEDCCNELG